MRHGSVLWKQRDNMNRTNRYEQTHVVRVCALRQFSPPCSFPTTQVHCIIRWGGRPTRAETVICRCGPEGLFWTVLGAERAAAHRSWHRETWKNNNAKVNDWIHHCICVVRAGNTKEMHKSNIWQYQSNSKKSCKSPWFVWKSVCVSV